MSGVSHSAAPIPSLVARATVVDVDGYQGSVRGVDLRAVRIGVGNGPNSVSAVSDDKLTVTSCEIGFPIASWTTMAADRVLLAGVRNVAPGSRWCEIDLEGDSILAFGPELEYVGKNHPGHSFSFAVAEIDELKNRADVLRIPFGIPERGTAVDVSRREDAAEAIQMLFTIGALREGSRPPAPLMDDTLSALTFAFGPLEPPQVQARAGRMDSGRIVRRCVEYAEAVERRPSISELCLAAGVSERRLRKAFVSTFDTPPWLFFRHWALSKAHRRLTTGDSPAPSVTDVATELGFSHLGRFAEYYRATYGVSPSTTTRAFGPAEGRAIESRRVAILD